MKKLFTAITLILCGSICLATLSTDYSPAQYNTNGSTTQFQVQWSFFATSDLVVYHTDSDGVDTTLTEGSGTDKYTVYAPNSDYSNGATITTGTTYPSGGRITIERVVPYGQELSINGDFIPAKPLETQLDKLAAQNQQTSDSIGRTLTIPSTDLTTIDTEFPNAETRAGLTMAFDASGNVTVLSPVASSTIYVDESTLTITTNLISVKASGITSNQLADLCVLNTNLTDDAVQTRNILDGDVTTAKIDDEAITLAKMADMGDYAVIGNVSGGSATPAEVAIIDDDTMGTATDSNLSTSESIKAYVDSGLFTQFSTNIVATTTSPINVAHSLGGEPLWFQVYLKCTTTDLGYAVGDLVIPVDSDASGGPELGAFANSTNIGASFGAGLSLPNKATGTPSAITEANWDFILRAWK